ncbi:MAG: Nuclease SbcCD subunit [Verrucomicrobiales bacterium]|nr:Nuclease SbcCD subunit [Verrucomicrobiales bacterium]
MVHSADWHLGKMLGEHGREQEHQQFLAFLLEQIAALSVDVLVIAGDVFDSANPPQSAVSQYYDFLYGLFKQGGCSVVVVAGNHDSPAHLEAPRRLFKALGVHVIGAMPQAALEVLVPLPDANAPRLLVAAVPFLRDRDLRIGQSGQNAAEIQRSLVDGIQRRYDEVIAAAKPWVDGGIPVLGTGHLTVIGAKVSESEREIHVGGLGSVAADCFGAAFDYVALGHLHRPQAAGGREMVRYSGSPIPLSFSEAEDCKALQVIDFVGGKTVGQFALELPLMRRLIQLSASRMTLEAVLGGFRPPPTELSAWVELVIEDPVAGENLYDQVQEMARGRGFEVIRVGGKRVVERSGMTVAGGFDAERITELLAEPASVFAHRLEAEPGLTAEEKVGLTTVFKELLDLHSEQERFSETARGAGVCSGVEA